MSPAVPHRRLLLALCAALACSAWLLPSAQATEITPVGVQITAVNTTPVDFIPDNANSAIGFRCQNSTFAFTFATQRNLNRSGAGTFSGGPGSVITDLDPNSGGDRAAEFGDCAFWDFSSGSPVAPITMTTNESNGAWTFATQSIGREVGVVAIGMPELGQVVDIPALGCQFELTDDQASPLLGRFTSGSPAAAAALDLDAQVDLGGTCPFVTPAQIEGSFDVTSASGAPATVLP